MKDSAPAFRGRAAHAIIVAAGLPPGSHELDQEARP